jgi:cytochrome c5
MKKLHITALIGCLVALAAQPVRAQDGARLALGEKVFAENCKVCHETAKPPEGSPQIKDGADWKERLGNGRNVLYGNAIEGLRLYFDMPPRGGNPALKDDEVKAAVDYILERAGVR